MHYALKHYRGVCLVAFFLTLFGCTYLIYYGETINEHELKFPMNEKTTMTATIATGFGIPVGIIIFPWKKLTQWEATHGIPMSHAIISTLMFLGICAWLLYELNSIVRYGDWSDRAVPFTDQGEGGLERPFDLYPAARLRDFFDTVVYGLCTVALAFGVFGEAVRRKTDGSVGGAPQTA